MLLELTGVLRSGGRPSLSVPFDARQGLQIVAGMTTQVLVRVVDQQGAPVSLADATVILTVKKSPRNLSALCAVEGVPQPQLGANVVTVTLSAALTASWTSLILCYDVVLAQVDGPLNAIVPTSPLYVTPSVYTGPATGGGNGAPSTRGTVPAPGGPYPLIPAGTPVCTVNEVLFPADAGNAARMPCVGLYTGASSNLVRTDGLQANLVGLPADASVFVAVGGGLTATPPSVIGQFVQRIGGSVGTTNVFVEPGPSVRLV